MFKARTISKVSDVIRHTGPFWGAPHHRNAFDAVCVYMRHD